MIKPRQKVPVDIITVQPTKKYFFATVGKKKSVMTGPMILNINNGNKEMTGLTHLPLKSATDMIDTRYTLLSLSRPMDSPNAGSRVPIPLKLVLKTGELIFYSFPLCP